MSPFLVPEETKVHHGKVGTVGKDEVTVHCERQKLRGKHFQLYLNLLPTPSQLPLTNMKDT